MNSNPPGGDNERLRKLTLALKIFGPFFRAYFRRHGVPECDIDDLIFALFLSAFRTFPLDKLQFLPFYIFRALQILRDYWRGRGRFKRTQISYTGEKTPEIAVSGHFQEPANLLEEKALRQKFFEDFPAPLSSVEMDCLYYRGRGFGVDFTARISGLCPSMVEPTRRRAKRKFKAYVLETGSAPHLTLGKRKKGGNRKGGRDNSAS